MSSPRRSSDRRVSTAETASELLGRIDDEDTEAGGRLVRLIAAAARAQQSSAPSDSTEAMIAKGTIAFLTESGLAASSIRQRSADQSKQINLNAVAFAIFCAEHLTAAESSDLLADTDADAAWIDPEIIRQGKKVRRLRSEINVRRRSGISENTRLFSSGDGDFDKQSCRLMMLGIMEHYEQGLEQPALRHMPESNVVSMSIQFPEGPVLVYNELFAPGHQQKEDPYPDFTELVLARPNP